MRFNTSSAVSLVLLLTAASSLISMISILKIDGIVHGDLYHYGLQFSYQWAMPYWTMTTIVFAVGWFNIIVAGAFEFYVLIYGEKKEEAWRSEPIKEQQLQPQLQPTEEIIPHLEIKPTEKVEEYKEQTTQPTEEAEKKPQENQTVFEATPQPEQSEAIREQEKEQESKPPEETETESQEASTPATEAEHEEETEEEPQTAVEETSQQVGTSPL